MSTNQSNLKSPPEDMTPNNNSSSNTSINRWGQRSVKSSNGNNDDIRMVDAVDEEVQEEKQGGAGSRSVVSSTQHTSSLPLNVAFSSNIMYRLFICNNYYCY